MNSRGIHGTPDDDWLDQLLETEDAYIADDGFTEAVVARLPRPLSTRARASILTMLGAAATALILVLGGPEPVGELFQNLGWSGGLPGASMGLAVAVLAGIGFTPLVMAAEEA